METIKLQFPIKSPTTGAEISVVELRRPTLKDLKEAGKNSPSPEDRALNLLTRCCTNLSPDEVDALDMADALTLMNRINEAAPNFPTKS